MIIEEICTHSHKENTEDSGASFLDQWIKVQNKVFHTSLYDKPDTFSFDIVNFPDLSGNIPKTSYGGLSPKFSDALTHE